MVFAVWYTRGMGFQGFMPPLAVLGSLVALLSAGAGKYALSSKSFRRTLESQ
jgi:uncharacterized membrane protein YphA (DoxX/SURF4 family)